LVGRGVEKAGVGGEGILRAVAVVHVEIEDGNALEPVDRAGVQRADGDVVEQAKSHGPAALGVVAGGPHRAKGIAALARRHRIHGTAQRPHRAQRRLPRAGGNGGVEVEADAPGLRNGGHGLGDIRAVVHALDLRAAGAARLAPRERGELRRVQCLEYGLKPCGAFGMPRAGVVLHAGGMGENEGCHAPGGKN
jgi:hypothetical protein